MVISFRRITVCLIFIAHQSELARILGVFPIPSISHQVVFRPVMLELVRRGHEVTVITTDPAFLNRHTPPNYTEIDVHDTSYALWDKFSEDYGNIDDQFKLVSLLSTVITNTFEEQLKLPEVQNLIKDGNRNFDLLIMDALARPALVFSHFYNIPAISFSTLSGVWGIFDIIGATTHPLVYPEAMHTRIHNLTLWEKLTQLHLYLTSKRIYMDNIPLENQMIKKNFGPNVPDLRELIKNIQMFFINVHPIWDHNRPVPPNVIYLGGLHLKPQNELPQDLNSYLNSSKTGVIYVSFGTNVIPSMFPPEQLKVFTNVFSKLPYDILMKWDKDELPGVNDNVKIFKWTQQADLLRHPNVKLFITQCGQQSTDEALMAGVPLIGIPIFGDQLFNAEQYVKFKIGKKLLLGSFTEEELKNDIETVIRDKSYHENVIKLRKIITDQPHTSLERAVWWTEHLLRHGGATHLRAPAALMHWTEYYELRLVLLVLTFIVLILLLIIFLVFYVIFKFMNNNGKFKKYQ